MYDLLSELFRNGFIKGQIASWPEGAYKEIDCSYQSYSVHQDQLTIPDVRNA